jgi:hypothetical protein
MRPRTIALALLGAAIVVRWAVACDDWPPGEHGNDGGYYVTSPPTGICAGTPVPCEQLGGATCGLVAGCSDRGTCQGVAVTVGQVCGVEYSYSACNSIIGCYWRADCTGVPLGGCSAPSEQLCLRTAGCVWTNNGFGGFPGAGGSASDVCSTYGAFCRTNSACDCGFSCVLQCPGCPAVCARPCLRDLQCVGANGRLGTPTPYCLKQMENPTTPYSGVCSPVL